MGVAKRRVDCAQSCTIPYLKGEGGEGVSGVWGARHLSGTYLQGCKHQLTVTDSSQLNEGPYSILIVNSSPVH